MHVKLDPPANEAAFEPYRKLARLYGWQYWNEIVELFFEQNRRTVGGDDK